MSTTIKIINKTLLFFILMLLISCSGQNKKAVKNKPEKVDDTINKITGDTVSKIGGEIRCIFRDSKNNIWFATNGDGVFKYEPGANALEVKGKRIIQFKDKNGLPSNYVWDIGEDKKGNIWFKTNIRPADVDAICYFDGEKFRTLQTDVNFLQAKNYNYLDDFLFAGYYYTGKSLVKIKLPHTSPLNDKTNLRFRYDIYSACKDKEGNLWFGTFSAGVCKYDGKTYTWLDDKALAVPVRAIFEDKNGIIWIGNNGNGLFRYDPKGEAGVINFSKQKKLENYDRKKYPTGKEGMLSRVWTITDDNLGNLWIGTIDNGVWMYDGKTVTNYTTKNGLGIDNIWAIGSDKNNNLWFGTDGAGVYTFNGKTFTKFTGEK